MSGQQEEEANVSFFVMSGDALRSLNDELQILIGEQAAGELLERFGFRCGEGLVQSIGYTCEKIEELKDTLPGLMIETGLGRSKTTKITEDEIIIEFEESLEALAKGKSDKARCNFTKGYLAGVLSTLFDARFDGTEDSCTCKGDGVCIHRLVRNKGYVKPAAERVEETAKKFALETGTSYLMKEESPDVTYEVFQDYVTHGHQGLCITRDFPAKVRKKYGLEKTPIIWLSTSETENTVPPQNLSALFYHIENFLKKSDHGIILLSGLEYLITHNSYQSVLKFIQLLNEQIAIRDSILVVPISPLTMDEKDLKLFERELTPYEMKT
jgi:predicted hydrocarbon binding protein